LSSLAEEPENVGQTALPTTTLSKFSDAVSRNNDMPIDL
jgi:hypothetical protein